MPNPSTAALLVEAATWCKARDDELSAAIQRVYRPFTTFPFADYGAICQQALTYAVSLKAARLIPELGATEPDGGASMAEALRQVQLLAEWLAATDAGATSEGGDGGRHQEDNNSAMSLRRVGETWHVRYRSERVDFSFRGNRYIEWLAKLLSKPDHGWTVAELYGDAGRKLGADASLGGECVTDKAGLRAIWQRIQEIRAIADQTGGSEELENEEQQLLRRVERHSARERMPAAIAKAYNNVTTQKRKFLQKLKSRMPQLAAHLKACLVQEAGDYTLSYRPPAGTPRWEIENPSA
jgi:hypothetical protein